MDRSELIALASELREVRKAQRDHEWGMQQQKQRAFNLAEQLNAYVPAVPIHMAIAADKDITDVYLAPLPFSMAQTMFNLLSPQQLILNYAHCFKPAIFMDARDHEHAHQDISPFFISVSWIDCEPYKSYPEAKFEWWWKPEGWNPGGHIHLHMPIKDAEGFMRYEVHRSQAQRRNITSQYMRTRFPGCFKQEYSSTDRTIPNYFVLYWDMGINRPDNILIASEFN